jgi:opacity protein-like surface antigen
MKRFTLTFSILCAACALSYAGTESYSGKDKEVVQQAPAPCEWYRAHEWDFNFWATFAMPYNTGRNHDFRTSDFDGGTDQDTGTEQIDIGEVSNDRFINRDNALGGGMDIKYFFSKHWGLGAEGFVVDANDNAAGGGLATLTFRWPIGCSRFAPYIFTGFGATEGGSHTSRYFVEQHPGSGLEPEFRQNHTNKNTHTNATGQVGAGLEIRITHHIGLMGDYVYNVLEYGHNDFGMVRAGVTLSY